MSSVFISTVANVTRIIIATALCYIAFTAMQISKQVATLEPVLKQAEQLQQHLPDILQRVDSITAQVPEILKRVDDITEQIPVIVAESKAIREDLPAFYQHLAATNQSIDALAKQVPVLVAESEQLRIEVPVLLQQADSLTEKIDATVNNASEGFVPNMFTGLVKMPLSILPSFTELFPEQSLNQQDRDIIRTESLKALEIDIEKEPIAWQNPQSKRAGVITILDEKQQAANCRALQITLEKKNKQVAVEQLEVCKNAQGQWEL